MTGKRKVFWLVIATLVLSAFLFVWWLFSSENQPTYEGRKLSEWAQEVKFLDRDSLPLPLDDAVLAIQAMGTNALPYAIRWLSPDYRDQIKEKCDTAVEKFNGSQNWLNFDTDMFRPQPKWGWAMGIFYALGTNAHSAIPELIALLEGSDIDASRGAAEALSQTGVESIPYLLHSLASTNRHAVEGAIQALMLHGTNAVSATPLLLDYLRRDFWGLGDLCAFAMWRIAPESPEFHEAMIQKFEASYPQPSNATYLILGSLGTNAASVAPRLIEIIESDKSPLGNGQAVRALCKIDPIRGEFYAARRKAATEAWNATNQPPSGSGFDRYLLRNSSTNDVNTATE